jgi:hypothetical protein
MIDVKTTRKVACESISECGHNWNGLEWVGMSWVDGVIGDVRRIDEIRVEENASLEYIHETSA